MATETKSIPLVRSTFTLVAGPGLISMHAAADNQVQICIAASLPDPTEDDTANLEAGWSTLTITTNNLYARSAGADAVLLPVIKG